MPDRFRFVARVRGFVSRTFGLVRVRVTVAAVLVAGIALIAAAGVVQWTLDRNRHSVLLNTAQVQAREVEALNSDLHSSPVALPLGATLETGAVQVIRNHKVIAQSKMLHNLKALLWEPGDPMIGTDSAANFAAHDVRIVALPVTVGPDKATVAVAVSLDQYDKLVVSVRRLLNFGLPILLGIVGLICWFIVGRALRRIETLRLEVAQVATRPGEHRVADPRTDDEVGRLARTLNSMLDRLEQSSARERRFVADASHELRSPIANIRTTLEVALHHPNEADWASVAGEVLDEDGRMGHLVEDLLLLARSDEGRLLVAHEPVDLFAVAESVVTTASHASTGYQVDVNGTPTAVKVPAPYLERIVTNLVENACRYARSRVVVSVGRRGQMAVLEVRDDGPGIPGADAGRVFERFVRLDEARDREHGGFGLGLAIVADLCQTYGGTIEISEAHPGAAFTVQLPTASGRLRRRPAQSALEPAGR